MLLPQPARLPLRDRGSPARSGLPGCDGCGLCVVAAARVRDRWRRRRPAGRWSSCPAPSRPPPVTFRPPLPVCSAASPAHAPRHPTPTARVSRGCALEAGKNPARLGLILVWASLPARPLPRSLGPPLTPRGGLSRGLTGRRVAGCSRRWAHQGGSRSGIVTVPAHRENLSPQARRGGFALAAVRAPPGTQLSSLLRREHGGFNVSSPAQPWRDGAPGGLASPQTQSLCERGNPTKKKERTHCTTLSGGSLGSCVDEERS